MALAVSSQLFTVVALVVEVLVNKVDEFDDVVTVMDEFDPVVGEGSCERIGFSKLALSYFYFNIFLLQVHLRWFRS